MAFSVSDYEELVRLLEAHPELRAGLRRLLFVDERDELRKILGELAAAQKRTEESLAALTERVEQLAEAQRRTEQRLEQLAEAQRHTEERLEQLAEAQRHTEQRLEQLAEAQRHTEQRLAALTERVDQLAEAQRRTEDRLEQLAEAQRHTEQRLAALTERVDQLAEAQRHTEQRLAALTERVDQLAEAQRHTEQRLAALTERVDQLAEAQRHTEQRLAALTERVDQLAEAQRHTEQGLLSLTAQVRLLTNEVAQLKGSALEQRYRDRAPAYFAPLMRRIHALSSEELAALLEEAELSGALTEAERQELLNTDIVVHGLWRLDETEAYLAVEVSGGVGAHDVERAAARATLLSRITGKRAIPVVAGQAITDEGERAAKRLRAWCVLDGRCAGPSDSQNSF